MNIKDILADRQPFSVPLFKSDNYSNVYKKTEKITCAVFLLTDEPLQKSHSKDILKDVREYAKSSLVSVTHFLSSESSGDSAWSEVVKNLSTLRSLLYVLVASRLLRSDLADILAREIDGVVQNISYAGESISSPAIPLEELPPYIEEDRKRTRTAFAGRVSSSYPSRERKAAIAPSESTHSRREAVLTVIRQKGLVTIKDIAESVTNCSEKTIQRELIELIKDGTIIKEGERRWSKYKIV